MLSRLDALNRHVAGAIRWLALAMVLVTLFIVVLRYGFNRGDIALQESVMYMHGLLFLLGIPYGVRENTHVRVDVLYTRLSERARRYVDLVGHCLFLIPIAAFILYTSWPYTVAAWAIREGSPEADGIQAVYLLKTLIPLAAVLLLYQGALEIAKTVRWLRETPRG